MPRDDGAMPVPEMTGAFSVPSPGVAAYALPCRSITDSNNMSGSGSAYP